MRKLVLCLVSLFLLAMPTPGVARTEPNSEAGILKARQKQERQQFKQRKKFAKAQFKGQHVPKSIRREQKHQLERDWRTLRDRQKAEMQQMQDRRAVYKESLRNQ